MTRCDNCGRPLFDRPYSVKFGARVAHVCGDCLEKLASGIAMVERVTRKAAA